LLNQLQRSLAHSERHPISNVKPDPAKGSKVIETPCAENALIVEAGKKRRSEAGAQNSYFAREFPVRFSR